MKKLLALALCALTLVFACAAAMADASITFQMGGEPECMDPTINDYSSGSYALQSLFRGLYNMMRTARSFRRWPRATRSPRTAAPTPSN